MQVCSATDNSNYAHRASGLAPCYTARETHSPVEWRVKVKSGQCKTPRANVWEDMLFVDYTDVDAASVGVCDELVDEDITFQVRSAEIDGAEKCSCPRRSSDRVECCLSLLQFLKKAKRRPFTTSTH